MGVAQGVVPSVVLRGDALLNGGSNVELSRKCSCIFVISNRPNGRHHWTGPGHPVFERGVGPTVHRDVGDVWPHKGGLRAAGGCGPPRPESGHVRPHVGTSPRQPTGRGIAIAGRQEERTCNSAGWSYDVRPPQVRGCRRR